jgi:hypothetical protein
MLADFTSSLRELASKYYVNDRVGWQDIYPQQLVPSAVRMLILNRYGFLLECRTEDERRHQTTIRVPVLFKKSCEDGHEVAEELLGMVASSSLQ